MVEHSYFGTIDLSEGFAELDSVMIGDREVTVEIDAEDGEPSEVELDALAEACKSYAAWTEKVVQQAKANFDELLKDALQVWSEDDPDLVTAFDPDAKCFADLTADQVISKMHLTDIRMEGSSPSEIAFDLQFNLDQEIDYLICGRFDCKGFLSAVTLES